MNNILLFLITYIFVLLIYEIFIVYRTKKRKAKGISKEPMEVMYLINMYKLDIKKVNYNQLLQIISFVSSLDITIVVNLVTLPSNFIIRIILAFVSVLGSILLSYYLVYLYYKKKGLIK